MPYFVKELYYTLQGEGANVGRAAVFCRFAGCNLWSGREVDRASAICRFCDTDFVGTDGPGGGVFQAPRELACAVATHWPGAASQNARPLVVFTGGEPLLQLDDPLVSELHCLGFEVAIETNGTIGAPAALDWICVSPKAGTCLVLTHGDELKLIYPQAGIDPAQFTGLDFRHFFLQPMNGPERERNTHLALRYCLDHPRWRLSLQVHTYLGIP
jgi:7-carboxy-7-deazaguanine synthase